MWYLLIKKIGCFLQLRVKNVIGPLIYLSLGRTSGSLYMLLYLILGSNCWNLSVWVRPNICSMFLSHFILILAFSSFISFTLYSSLSLSTSLRRSELLQKFFCEAHLAVPGWVWGLWRGGLNPNPIQVPPDDSIFALSYFGFLLGLPFHWHPILVVAKCGCKRANIHHEITNH